MATYIMEGKSRPELVFGLVGPLGVDLDQIYKSLSTSLNAVGYSSEKIVISKALSEVLGLEKTVRHEPEYERVISHMDVGDELRSRVGGGAAAILTTIQIQKSRKSHTQSAKMPHSSHAYVLKSLKHTDEIRIMRKIYGRSFWLISAYVSKENRLETLRKTMGDNAEKLVDRDYHDDAAERGQAVRETFPQGDVFVDASSPDRVREQIDRFVELVFGNTFHTPYAEESGMFYAFASSLRSSSLSRQVGAAILDRNGDLISTGTNEVPKAGGGTYMEGDESDKREFRMGYDRNQQKKINMLKDILSRLGLSGWLSESRLGDDAEMAETALKDDRIRGSAFMGLTEYGREVHAEMDALVGSARRGGSSVRDCIMYCTTFPCHICAKHIVASGIKRLVFIEPYPKSHAGDLFSDSISVGDPGNGRVYFKPYFGISPRRYTDMFMMGKRKDNVTGKMITWDPAKSEPRFWESKDFFEEEADAINGLVKTMKQNGLSIKRL